jgi:hypothetical protein
VDLLVKVLSPQLVHHQEKRTSPFARLRSDPGEMAEVGVDHGRGVPCAGPVGRLERVHGPSGRPGSSDSVGERW